MEEEEISEDADVYSENNENLVDNDQISPQEEGFMLGYNEEEERPECSECGEVIKKRPFTKEINGEKLKFCCQECAQDFEESV